MTFSISFEDPVYGTLEFTGAAARVIEHPAVQRLRSIHQNGGAFLVNPDLDTTRFEHSLGVAHLCKRLEAPEREVIAALVHDIGHTAFSHVADQVFERADQRFHEEEAGRIVDQYGLDDYLDCLGYPATSVLDAEGFSILEQDVPNLCADRLDYQLRDVYKYGLIDRDSVDEILRGITLDAGRPVASDRETAHALVDVSLMLLRQVFFNEQHEAANLVLADLIETALNKGLLTVDDLFQTDQEVLESLRSDSGFADRLDSIQNLSIQRTPSQPTHIVSRKFRIMDPHVEGTGQRISEIDSTVANKLLQFQETVPSKGKYTIILNG